MDRADAPHAAGRLVKYLHMNRMQTPNRPIPSDVAMRDRTTRLERELKLLGATAMPQTSSRVTRRHAKIMRAFFPRRIAMVKTITNETDGGAPKQLDNSGTEVLSGGTLTANTSVVLGTLSANGVLAGLGTAGAPSYSFSAGTSTGAFSPGMDTFAVSTAGTERVRIDSSGRVGIGTAPSAGNALHVIGNIFGSGQVTANTGLFGNISTIGATSTITAPLFVGNMNATTISTTSLTTGNVTSGTLTAAPGSTVSASYQFTNSANTGMYSPLSSTLGFVTSGTERVRVTPTGFVGFNTTAPTEQIHVVGNVLVAGSLNANTGTFSNIVTGSLSATTGEFALEDLVLSGDTNRLIYSDADGALRTSTATMSDTGNVTAGSVTVLGGTAASPGFSFSDAGTFSPSSNVFAVSTGGIERVRIDLNGNMGLGTAAPETTLHVTGSSTFQSMQEATTPFTGATGVLDHNWSLGSIFYHTNIADNFTVNVQNLPVADGRTTTVTLILVQGLTARMATAVQISGVAHTIRWEAGFVPTGTASKWNIVSFSFVRIAGAWTVFGQSVVFG